MALSSNGRLHAGRIGQIERGETKRPGIHILKAISDVLFIDIDVLTSISGCSCDGDYNDKSLSIKGLTRSEYKELMNYLDFIRYHRATRG